MRFGEYLREQRLARRWSQEELAHQVEQITRMPFYSRNVKTWEQGRGEQSLPWVEVLSRVFDFDLPWLTEDTELRRPPPRGRKARRS